MTFWTAALMATLCVLVLSAAFWLAVRTVREAIGIERPQGSSHGAMQESEERRARRLQHELENFMRYDGSEQEEIAQ